MTHSIADLAKEFELKPGHVYGVLSELGIEHDGESFDAESDDVELVKASLLESVGSKTITLRPGATPRDVALALGLPLNEVSKTLIKELKTMATATTSLKDDILTKVVSLFDYEVNIAEPAVRKPKPVAAGPQKGAQKRPPVVTIMGHVDHGKTSLLDYIRKANVAEGEAGGITQHIGAYQVEMPEGKITFLDTPGHAAFTSMRARGASVTDLVILVVAADDGIMPTTIEAIQHAKAAKVPIIVAVNKIDKPGANPDRVMQQLPEQGLVPEAYGGDVICQNVSALTGEGVPDLLEQVILLSDILELKADPKGPIRGAVVEAKLDKGRGPVATILVQEGTLRAGDMVVVGHAAGRVRAMTDFRGQKLDEAGPSTPVEIQGLDEVPGAGDDVRVTATDKEAKSIAEARRIEHRDKTVFFTKKTISLKRFKQMQEEDGTKELNLVLKADVQGSVDAVRGMLEKIRNEEVETRVILSGVGSINDSDVMLAKAADAIIVGFNVKPENKARQEAEKQKVEIRTYNIIYELAEDIEAAVKGMLEPKFEERELGTVDIRVRFQFGKKGIIAGCYVTEGKITRNAKVRVYRGRDTVYEGTVNTLKHLKDDVREVTVGMECGLTFEGWEAFQEGDRVEAYEMVQVNV